LPTERIERRLAAILAADVAGYSRLMEADTTCPLSAKSGHTDQARRSARPNPATKNPGQCPGLVFIRINQSIRRQPGLCASCLTPAFAMTEKVRPAMAMIVTIVPMASADRSQRCFLVAGTVKFWTKLMSALLSTSNIREHFRNVRFVPVADMGWETRHSHRALFAA
jgi:hypothetical protein